TDPAGFIFGTVHTVNGNISGTTTNKLTYAYTSYATTAASANNRDYDWLQNIAGTNNADPALDTPWDGTIWDLGGQANQAVVFPIVDHGPLPQEAAEYTVYLTNDPTSTNLTDWSLALLDQVYLQGWEDDTIALADGFTTVWKLPGNATFRYVSVRSIGSQALQNISGNEDEIDAVGGLTVSGGGLGNPNSVPEPLSLLLMGTGLAALRFTRRRRA
ncbi:MAG TPA: PEP-CTERM sorting domain-containing protein, partial [Gammaproteobacteria bacterium]|nr:PEP-CTERM sorting domain-containing protein [Gammaproteobacteria bacterium]